MDHDLTIMIYGAIMGVVGSIISSLISTIFQFWLARREYERRQSEEQSRQVRHVHLPTAEEVIRINSRYSNENEPEAQRKTVETGSLILSTFTSGILVYKTNDPMLGFIFSALLGFLLTNRAIRSVRS